MEEGLQKLLAQAGYGSRRACEQFIIEGRVRVNGQVAELGQKADLAVDKVTIDGKALSKAEALTYIALYKPRNVLSAAEGHDDRETVRRLLPIEGHLYPVGRYGFWKGLPSVAVAQQKKKIRALGHVLATFNFVEANTYCALVKPSLLANAPAQINHCLKPRTVQRTKVFQTREHTRLQGITLSDHVVKC